MTWPFDVPDVSGDYASVKEVAEAIDRRLGTNQPPSAGINETVRNRNIGKANRMIQALEILHSTSHKAPDPLSGIGIGMVWVKAPTSAIQVREVLYNDEIEGLRTSSSALIKTGRGQIRIEIQLEFPDDTSINEQLRPLVAQFRATPFLPLESYYVRNAVLAIGSKSPEDLDAKLEEVRKKYLQRVRLQAEVDDKVKRILHDPDLLFVVDYLIRSIPNSGLGTGASGWAEKHAQDTPGELMESVNALGPLSIGLTFMQPLQFSVTQYRELNGNEVLLEAYKKLEICRDQLAEVDEEMASLAKSAWMAGVAGGSVRPIVPVVLHDMDIQTIPGERGLSVRLGMLYFFHKSYSRFFYFRDRLGGPTPDIDDCPFFKMYLDRTFLNGQPGALLDGVANSPNRFLGKVDSTSGCGFYFRYPTPQLEPMGSSEQPRDVALRVTAEQAGGRPAGYMGASLKQTHFKTHVDTLDILPSDPNIIPSQISIQLRNRIVLQPIEGAPYGTAQYLGGTNARVSILFSVVGDTQEDHDDGIGRLQRMKVKTQNVSLIYGKKARRNVRIGVRNDLLGLAGIQYLQLDGSVTKTVPGERMSSMVQMDFTEFTVSQERREMIRHAEEGPKVVYETTLEFAAKIDEAWLNPDRNYQLTAVSKDCGQKFHEFLFGGADPLSEVITFDLVRNLLVYSLPEVRAAILNETGFSNQPAAIETSPSGEPDPYTPLMKRAGDAWLSMLGGETATEEETKILVACSKAALEVLRFWSSPYPSGPAKLTLNFGGRTVTIEPMAAYTRKLVALIRAMGTGLVQTPELRRLDNLSKYVRENFGTIRDYINAKVSAVLPDCAYPDLALPRYLDLFEALLDPSVDSFQKYDTPRLKEIVDRMKTSGNNAEEVRAILARFMPTFQDLGKLPPLIAAPTDPAKNFTDFVDPDFYFYHHRYSNDLDEIRRSWVKDLSESPLPSDPNTKLPTAKDALCKQSLIEADERRWSELMVASQDLAAHRKTFQAAIRNPDFVPEDRVPAGQSHYYGGALEIVGGGGVPNPEFRYKPVVKEVEAELGKFVHYNKDHLKSLANEAWNRFRDDTSRMIRAFPSFKLYFVELDQEAFGYWDDFYGYNAVSSLSLSKHKFEPDLLQIQLINVTGNLDEARSKMESQGTQRERIEGDPTRGDYPTPDERLLIGPGGDTLEDGTMEPTSLDQFYLTTGTNMRLFLGYGSGRDDLDEVFSGSVVEISPGDITTILCQSYKNELTVPLNSARPGSKAEPYEVVDWVMEMSPTIHFGAVPIQHFGSFQDIDREGSPVFPDSTERQYSGMSKEQAERRKQAGRTLVGFLAKVWGRQDAADILKDLAASGTFGGKIQEVTELLETVGEWLKGRKLWNVYLPRDDFLSTLLRWKREFVIPDRTGVEVLHELTRHIPGYVCDVRMYDQNATLFLGKPEQRYFYTGLRQDEERAWAKLSSRAREVLRQEIEKLVAKYLKTEDWQDLSMRLTSYVASTEASKELLKKNARGIYLMELHDKEYADFDEGLLAGAWGWVKNKTKRMAVVRGWAGQEEMQATYWRKVQGLVLDKISKDDMIPVVDNVESMVGTGGLQYLTEFFFNFVSSTDVKSGASLKTEEQIELEIQRGRKSLLARSAEFLADREGLNKALAELVDQVRAKYSGVKPGVTGTVLVSVTDWRSKVTAVSQAYPDSIPWDYLRYTAFEVQRADYGITSPHETNSNVRTSDGRTIGRAIWEDAVDTILSNIASWKVFIHSFLTWLEEQMDDPSVNSLIGKAVAAVEVIGPNPRTKRFQDYHFVDSELHIIKNGIIATKDQMANTVVVRYPKSGISSSGDDTVFVPGDTTWKTHEFKFDVNLDPQDKKVRLVTELNADDDSKVNIVGNSNLAEALRPMYRGELILRGDGRIKPFDVVWINDTYNNVVGPVEVERAIFNFDSERGFTTTVIPHAHVISGSGSGWNDALTMGRLLVKRSLYYACKLAGAKPGEFQIMGPKTTAKMALATGLMDQVLRQNTGTGMIGHYCGRGTNPACEVCIDLFPLLKNGLPWTAGLRGLADGSWLKSAARRIENMKRGWKLAYGFYQEAKGMYRELH